MAFESFNSSVLCEEDSLPERVRRGGCSSMQIQGEGRLVISIIGANLLAAFKPFGPTAGMVHLG